MFQRKEVEIFMEIYVANIKFLKLVILFNLCDSQNI